MSVESDKAGVVGRALISDCSSAIWLCKKFGYYLQTFVYRVVRGGSFIL
ncbi:hypothetical protein [Bartonella queenslandensis]|nr:hypothetical protein [Bartonella queenslandensis]